MVSFGAAVAVAPSVDQVQWQTAIKRSTPMTRKWIGIIVRFLLFANDIVNCKRLFKNFTNTTKKKNIHLTVEVIPNYAQKVFSGSWTITIDRIKMGGDELNEVRLTKEINLTKKNVHPVEMNQLEFFYHEQFYAAKIFTMHTKQTNHRPKYHISSQWKSPKEEKKNPSSENKSEKKGNGGSRSWLRMVWKKNTALPRYMQIFAYGFQAKRLDCADWFLLLRLNFPKTEDDFVNIYSQKEKRDLSSRIVFVYIRNLFYRSTFKTNWPVLNFITFFHATRLNLLLEPFFSRSRFLSLSLSTQISFLTHSFSLHSLKLFK